MTAPAPPTCPSPPLTLVKLGGSLITDKRRQGRARVGVIARLGRELAAAARAEPGRLLVGHGSGSFGHVPARRYRIHEGISSPHQLAGIVETRRAARRLHRRMVNALAEAGGLPFSFSPSSFLVLAGGEARAVGVEPVVRALALGLVPVVHGDVVMDRDRGAGICSTEGVFLALAAALAEEGPAVEQVLWLGETDGVWDREGRTVERVVAGEESPAVASVLAAAGPAAGADVTGGMRHRLEAALAFARRGVPSWIVDGRRPGLLAELLAGGIVPGTRVEPPGERWWDGRGPVAG